jgi:hypothetical protein
MKKSVSQTLLTQITDEDRELLRMTASPNRKVAGQHRRAMAQVVEGAWRAGVLEPDLLDNIFEQVPLPPGGDAKIPLDFYSPGNEGQYVAFLMPKEGGIPQQSIEGDELYLRTYKIAHAIDWSLDYARDARWDVVARAIEAYTNGFIRRINDDGWHTVLHNASLNTVQTDANATSGVLSLTLVTTLQTAIKRLTSGRNSRVTDLYVSPEGLADIRNLAAFQVTSVASANRDVVIDDESIRRLILSPEDTVPTLFGVRIHELQELGVSQEYETYLTSTLGATHAGKAEFCVALDLANRDSFVMPVRENMSMFDDPTLHRFGRAGVYGWMEIGFAAIDTRRALLGAF